jgi:hypothetical protein
MIPKPTQEMIDFFEKRTKEHIARVRANLVVLANSLPGIDADDLRQRAKVHDKSKWSEEEYFSYVWITWYRDKVGGHIPDNIQQAFNKACKHHWQHNTHHPEHYLNITSMSKEDLAEMLSDWASMSQEFHTSLKNWVDYNIPARWKFSKEQINFIITIVDLFKQKKLIKSDVIHETLIKR